MLRPVTMSRTSIIFLKSETEQVMEVINKHGAFHLTIKELDGQTSSEYAEKAQELGNRVRDVINRATSLTGRNFEGESNPVTPLQNYRDWPSLLSSIDAEVSSYENRLRELEIRSQRVAKYRPILEIWKSAVDGLSKKADFSTLGSLKHFKAIFLQGPADNKEALKKAIGDSAIVVEAAPTISIVICDRKSERDSLRAAEEAEYRPIEQLDRAPSNYSDLPSFLRSYEKDLTEIETQVSESSTSLARDLPKLRSIEAVLSDSYSVLSIRDKTSLQKNWAIIEGYVPSNLASDLISSISERVDGRVIPFTKEEHSSSSVPVSFRYPRFMKIFDSITNLYGTPSYNEVNPTPILAITFPLFFGLMFGDLGHGLTLAAIGFFMFKKVTSMKKIGLVLMIAGIAGALVGGIVYGEIFGKPLADYIPYQAPLHIPHEEGEFMTYLMQLLKISLFVGISQISLGLSLTIVNNFIQKKYEAAALINIPKLALYWAFMYVVWTTKLQLMQWFGGPIYYILAPLLFLLLASPIYSMAKHGRKEGLGHLGEMGFDLFESMISFTSNTVSYLRIFAMVIAHIELTAIFYTLGSMVGGGPTGMIFSGILIVMGNLFVVLLEGILVLAQDLRLHFYEWFSKFYQDGGVRFSPFKLSLGVPIRK
uniref:A-type ATP synthase subunit I n=1 Tax=Candidatus Methanomethylicus mesodigestus TaxID=1867258 RepID=A0A7C3FAG8_9CREN